MSDLTRTLSLSHTNTHTHTHTHVFTMSGATVHSFFVVFLSKGFYIEPKGVLQGTKTVLQTIGTAKEHF